jgi:hypothetical protein
MAHGTVALAKHWEQLAHVKERNEYKDAAVGIRRA